MKTPRDWVTRPLSQFVSLQRGFDLPTHARVPGSVPVLSSGGVNGSHNEAKVDGDNFVIGRVTNIGRPTWSSVPFWPLNTTLFVKDFLGNFPKFCFYWFLATDLSGFDSGSVQPTLNRNYIANIPVAIPSFVEQRRIAGVLGALDDKIDLLNHQRTLCRKLGLAYTERLTRDSANVPLEYYTRSISRGVTPKYYKNEEETPIHVLNQRCVRDGWVSLNSARLMLPRRREKKAAMAEFGDLLVNSTGQGTLGRVGRWSHQAPIYADSHMTIVKADPQRIYPILLPYLVFPLQSEIEQMAEGSTGQTELSPSNLGSLKVPFIHFEEQGTVAAQLLALEEMAHHCSIETRILAELRDTLLPELMSGRMRVDEAGRLVSEALNEEAR